MKRFIYILVLFCSPLLANLKDPNVHAVTEGDPSYNICDSVNLLTGDFIAFSQDVTIEGAQPLYLKRSYVSGDGRGENGGWTFFPHLKLKMVPKKNQKDGRSKNFRRIVVAEPSGSKLIYKRQSDNKQKWPTYCIDFKKHGKGITNISHGVISGRTNLKNNVLYLTGDSTIKLVAADGAKRYYEKISEKKECPRFLLRKERLLNGNCIVYSYDDYDRLSEVKSTNYPGTKVYASFKVHYKDRPSQERDFSIETSDGRWLHYRFHKKGNETPLFFLQNIEGPENPPETEEYIRPHQSVQKLVSQRVLPDGRRIKADYYFPHTINEVRQDIHIKVANEEDPRSDRVKILYMPVGQNGELVPTHRFIYDIERKKIKKKKYEYEDNGLTEVLDAYGNKSSLHFTSQFYPTKVEYYNESGLHHFIQMNWGQNGELKEKAIIDRLGTRLASRELIYDGRGNIVQENQRGNFTGNHADEVYAKYYHYNDKNLLARQEDDSGLVILYNYLSETDLLQAKFFLNKERIFQREFYEYSVDHILIGTIVDDGSNMELSDLAGVTERKIQRIALKNAQPALNLPEVIEEFALNIQTGQEMLLCKTHIHYSAQAKVIQKDIYDQEGKFCYSLKTDYDDRGRPIQESDPMGNRTKCTYDIHGNKITEVLSSGKQILRGFDHANRLIAQEEKIPTGEIRRTRFEYDYKNNKVVEVDPFGNVSRFAYDSFGNVIKIIYPNQNTEQFAYDNFGRKILTVDPFNRMTHTSYNSFAKPIEIVHPDGSRQLFRYTLDGKLELHTDQEGITVKFTYDLLGREKSKIYCDAKKEKIAEETYIYNTFHLLEKKDKNGVITRYFYDSAGRKIAEECAGERTEFEYDSLGRIYKEKKINDLNTLINVFQRDYLDRIIEERKEDLQGNILIKIQYQYDSLGNRTAITTAVQGKNSQETFIYDCFNRLVVHQDPCGGKTIVAYDEEHLNEQGQKVLRKITRDSLGTSTIEIYDISLHLLKQETMTPQGYICASEEWEYDACGNCLLHKSHIYQGTQYLRTFIVEKTYDNLNRLTSSTEEGDQTTYVTYTASGQLKKIQKKDGTTLEYGYNALGQLVSLRSSDRSIYYTYQYDGEGNLLKSEDHVNKTTTQRKFDSHGRLLQETLANGLTISSSYDLAGRKVNLRIPNNTNITYTYDALFLKKIDALNQQCSWNYDEGGTLVSQKLPGSLGKLSYTYDLSGRRTAITSSFFNQHLFYDALGNILKMDVDKDHREFSYDEHFQITQEKSFFPHQYSYDSSHNRHSKDNETYQFNNHNELLATGQSTYTYDQNGNTVTKKTPSSSITYKYDALDRLIEVTEGNLQKILFSYDSLHRRISKTCYSFKRSSGTWEKNYHHNYLYDGLIEIGAYDERMNRIQLRILAGGERQAALFEFSGKIYAPIQDLQGNVIKLVSVDNPAKSYSYTYNVFGEETSDDLFNPWRYASKRFDFETELVFFGRRFYDPKTGRWLTPDPMGYTDSINLYQYTFNNPFAHMDLFGLSVDFLDNIHWFSSTKTPANISVTTIEDHCARISREYMKASIHQPGFSFFRKEFEKTKTYEYKPEINSIRANPNRNVIFVNGVRNNFSNALETTAYFSKLGGGCSITLVHNPSYGYLESYRAKAIIDYQISETSIALVEAWKKYFANASADATCLVIAHSLGTAITRNALLIAPEEIRKRISVLCIAPSSYIYKYLCGNIIHYRSKEDSITRLFDQAGAKLCADTIVDLDPASGTMKFFDHEAMSPTYQPPIMQHLNNYLTTGKM